MDAFIILWWIKKNKYFSNFWSLNNDSRYNNYSSNNTDIEEPFHIHNGVLKTVDKQQNNWGGTSPWEKVAADIRGKQRDRIDKKKKRLFYWSSCGESWM